MWKNELTRIITSLATAMQFIHLQLPSNPPKLSSFFFLSSLFFLISYLCLGDAQEARRVALLIVQIFTERERETETLWPSMYTPEIFTDGTTSDKLFRQLFPTKGSVYVNGFCRGKRGQLSHTALSKRFQDAGFLL